MTTLVAAEGALLDRVLEASDLRSRQGLTSRAYGRFEAAQMKTPWGRDHRHRVALTRGDSWLASATRYDLSGLLDGRPIRICGIGDLLTAPTQEGNGHVGPLVEQLLDRAADGGADLALVFADVDPALSAPRGFDEVPMTALCLDVARPERYGAPMTLVRAGEPRDIAAIAAMGRTRAAPFRFHLDRDVDLVQYAITRRRLRAGLGNAGDSQLHFFIAEEGITAAAYVVISVSGADWTIEECGDRDPSGARLGAILQALLAREPTAQRPSIRAWLPAGFMPPQITIASREPSTTTLWLRALSPATDLSRLSGDDVLYWHGDLM